MKCKPLIILITICLIFTNFTFAKTQTIDFDNIDTVKINVKTCNVTLKKGSSDSIKFNYYGNASDLIYDLNTKEKENVLMIDIVYTGSDVAPSIEDGGIEVILPDKDIIAIDITGTIGAGITLQNITIDTNLRTEKCAVIISDNKAENKINIDSKYDSYKIKSAPLTKDLNLKAHCSVIKYKFSKLPPNLHFQLTDKGGKIELPKNWNYDCLIGTGTPNMNIDTYYSIFKLSY